MDLNRIFTILESQKGFKCGKPCTVEEIRNLEKEIGLRFPEAYKLILSKYGFISWKGDGIFGRGEKDDFYDLTSRHSRVMQINFPDDFTSLPEDAFVFKEYPGGGYFMLFSEDSPRAGEVGLFLHETLNNEDQTWPSFEAFLEDYYCSED